MNQLVSVLAGCGKVARSPHLALTSPVVDTRIRKIVHRTPRGDILLIGRQTAYFTPADLSLLPREHAIGVQCIADTPLSGSDRR
jgi:hypothetical protein